MGDPLWDPIEPERLIGSARLLLECLLQQVDNQFSARIISPEGNQAGTLRLGIGPLSRDGAGDVPDSELVEKQQDLLGSSMAILVEAGGPLAAPRRVAHVGLAQALQLRLRGALGGPRGRLTSVIGMTSNLLAALKSNQGKSNTVSVNPLIEAAKAGQVENCARALEEPKVKVDQKDPEGVSALMHAAQGGYVHVVKFLVEKGARIAAKDDSGETALMKACKEGHVEAIQYLIEAQVMQRKKTHGPLSGQTDAVKTIANERRRVLDTKDDEGVTALMKAAEQGEADIVKLLLDEGASLDLKDDDGWNVLMWAALQGHEDICEMLVKEPEYGMPADFCTEKGETALMKAAANGHWTCASSSSRRGPR
ncbi:unnamed protein product [Prorocentrum cordatum]|uniref:Uncharacterized protein n=1 Tax=Prorocentrum cordatum TaxID=2364126 RepID=A0ABN9VYK1_9DINO|nr:unnamed protein product [Polarella glacialis]